MEVVQERELRGGISECSEVLEEGYLHRCARQQHAPDGNASEIGALASSTASLYLRMPEEAWMLLDETYSLYR